METGKVSITIDGGERVEAVAPVIISASRRTDIPAFYAEWFMERLRRGYCVWVNPFNRREQYVSFQRCRVVVFWTKNPAPLLPFLADLDNRGIHYYFQYTLNDYETEGVEPGVPPLSERVETMRLLSERVGAERVVWRFDPLLLTPTLTPQALLRRVEALGEQLRGLTHKLVFSFVDVGAYRRVQRNLVCQTPFFTCENVCSAEPDAGERQVLAEGLARMRDRWASEGWSIELATCAEADDFSALGIAHNRCIDGELIERLWPEDTALACYLRTGHLPAPGLFSCEAPPPDIRRNMKDPGQRKACGCIVSKDIGSYVPCQHHCAYCYANTWKR